MSYKNKEKEKEHKKEYYLKHRERIKKQNKQWQQNNPEKVKEYYKRWLKNNFVKAKENIKQWNKNNREKLKKYRNQYYKNRYKTDLKYNLNKRMSRMIGIALKGNKAGRHWENLVGYTLEDLYERLNRTIPEGYIWQDYLEGKLEIDHIIPRSAFSYTKSEDIEFKKCWALKNLQLLTAEENLKKSDKV